MATETTARGTLRHELLLPPRAFNAALSGRKRHEVLANDGKYREGDELFLREYDASTDTYTGRYILSIISYITAAGDSGLPDDLMVLSFRLEKWNCGI